MTAGKKIHLETAIAAWNSGLSVTTVSVGETTEAGVVVKKVSFALAWLGDTDRETR